MLSDSPAPPGKTDLGVVLQVVGATPDRPTPAPDMYNWDVRYPDSRPAGCARTHRQEVSGVRYCEHSFLAPSFFYPQEHARAAGLGLFKADQQRDETPDGDALERSDNMQRDTNYYVEVFDLAVNSDDLADAKVCYDAGRSQASRADRCFTLASLPSLKR